MARLEIYRAAATAGLMVIGVCFVPAQAQTDSPAEAAPPALQTERLLPEVEIRGGPISWRKGLAAYNRGDYPEAERHFRSYRNQLGASILDINPNSVGGGISTEGIDTVNFNPGLPVNRVSASSASRIRENDRKRAGAPQVGVSVVEDSRARASYAVGASLLKQGKFIEARQYFASAVGQDHTLHDARLRLGMIALLENDRDEAARRLRQLENWCSSLTCDGTDELSTSVQTLRSAIELFDQGAIDR